MTTLDTGRGKQPRTPLAGPYGHPFHPVMVTIPIGAWVSSIVLDVVSMSSDNAALAEGSMWLVGIGVLGALVAALLGLMDLSTIERGTKAFKTGITHMVLNLVAVTLFTISWWIRYDSGADEVSTSAFVLSLVGAAILGASGWLGGKLAYHYGVRVADEHTQAEGFS